MTDQGMQNDASGELAVEVNALPIVAGQRGTVTLKIRNPFSEPIYIESIEAPSSEPLLPRPVEMVAGAPVEAGFLRRFFSNFSFSVWGTTISTGPLVADFGRQPARTFSFDAEPESEIVVRQKFQALDTISVKAAKGARVTIENEDEGPRSPEARTIGPHQEDIASFELRTAHWLFVTPKVLDLHAVIRFRLGTAPRSQVVPISLSIRPPIRSLMLGSVGGATFGYAARQLTMERPTFELVSSVISLLGILVMAIILSIVLARQDGTKGFVTLEDFYGAFIVGVILGYTGTSYFEGVIGQLGSDGGANLSVNAAVNAAGNAAANVLPGPAGNGS